MTSKEALEKIRNWETFGYDETYKEVYALEGILNDYLDEELDIIKKDLEVLEKIESKTYLLFSARKAISKEFDKWCIDNNVVNCSESMATWFLTIKLKEWLEND